MVLLLTPQESDWRAASSLERQSEDSWRRTPRLHPIHRLHRATPLWTRTGRWGAGAESRSSTTSPLPARMHTSSTGPPRGLFAGAQSLAWPTPRACARRNPSGVNGYHPAQPLTQG
ncbi:hypothetical protein D187_000588 [Cystobacter fuscus DSM 2262]|uniref:Uncharacterized protein n=1 Tax=Cystobacter fuscus (strain ATCC 25194 / DSM 2262 / NBRC 100088 / M29) TaxID=1242864 RepID=S9R7Y5_CYSF2|nr:hypothetical protein D187_000588 [Cystobacter fuscus DSM 2262]